VEVSLCGSGCIVMSFPRDLCYDFWSVSKLNDVVFKASLNLKVIRSLLNSIEYQGIVFIRMH
jgi:hypothetical protein